MRSFVLVLLAAVTSTFAYQVTSPGGSQNWTTSGPNTLTWVRVDTDPLNFTAVLTNVNQGAMPEGAQVLNALVDGTLGSIVCSPPSGGWPQGSGFRVNLAANAENLNSLLAQSDQFGIVSPSSLSGSSTSSISSSTTLFVSTTATPTTPGATSTTSDVNTTPTSSGAAVVGKNVEMGFLTAVAALAAFVTTHL